MSDAQPEAKLSDLIRTENALLEYVRARVIELGITYETVDEIAGLPARFTSKTLAGAKKAKPGKRPTGRHMTVPVLLWTLEAIGVRLMPVVDEQLVEKFKHQWTPRAQRRRKSAPARFGVITQLHRRNLLIQWGKLGKKKSDEIKIAKARLSAKLSAAGIKGNLKRWSKPTLTELPASEKVEVHSSQAGLAAAST